MIMMLHGKVTEFSFTRPDGSAASFVGSPYAFLLISGLRGMVSIGYEEVPVGRKNISGKNVDRILRYASEFISDSTVAEWRNLAGEPFVPKEVEQVCSECNGSGRDECYACGHDCECDECGGSGNVTVEEEWPARPLVKVADLKFDARHISPLLTLVEGDCTVSIARKERCLFLAGNGWTIALTDRISETAPYVVFPATEDRCTHSSTAATGAASRIS